MRTASGPVPATLDRLVRRCLEKDPDERYQAARDVAFALEGLGNGSEGKVRAGFHPGRLAPWSGPPPRRSPSAP